MKTIPKELIFNGRYHSTGELQSLAQSLISPEKNNWEQSLGLFILQWIDEKDFIEVKTSGSTGTPKLTRLSKKAMLVSASMTGSFFDLRENQVALLCLSTGYIAGMMMVVRAMAHRMNLVAIPPDGNPLKNIPGKLNIGFAAMVPAQVYNSLKTPESTKKLESIGTLIVGGAPLTADLEQLVSVIRGNIYATFGMTETITHIALRRINGPERNNNFTVLPGITIEKDDRGCLIADVPYLKGNRIVTNDLVDIKSPESFQWLGRADNIINRGGIKLIPETIEHKIASIIHQRFFIAGQHDPKLGEIPVLVIESSRQLSEKDKENLLCLIQPSLRKEEIPGIILQTVQFIETENGKVNRMESLKKAIGQ